MPCLMVLSCMLAFPSGPVQDAGPDTPIFVFLSPGVDVAGSVEALGQKLGFTQENGKYFSVSLGQGQVRGNGMRNLPLWMYRAFKSIAGRMPSADLTLFNLPCRKPLP